MVVEFGGGKGDGVEVAAEGSVRGFGGWEWALLVDELGREK